MSPSPSRFVREPNLPIRKKFPRTQADNARDVFILGDQSKFRLDMILYRTRSLSAQRYSDSTDMLKWLCGDDDDDDYNNNYRHHHSRHRSRSRLGDNADGGINDSHYHKRDDDLQIRQHKTSHQPYKEHANSVEDSENLPSSRTRMNSPKKVQLNLTDKNTQEGFQRNQLENDGIKSKAGSSPRKNSNQMATNVNKIKKSTRVPTVKRKESHVQKEKNNNNILRREFITKSDVGKFLSEKHKKQLKESRAKQTSKISKSLQNNDHDFKVNVFPDLRSELAGETKVANNSLNSIESLGEAIVNKSNQNKENVNNNVSINERIQNTNRVRHHHRKHGSEYQDKFQWRGDDSVSASANLNRSQPKLNWLADETYLPTDQSEYTDQFRPKSAMPFQIHHTKKHHHNFLRDYHCEHLESSNIRDAAKGHIASRNSCAPKNTSLQVDNTGDHHNSDNAEHDNENKNIHDGSSLHMSHLMCRDLSQEQQITPDNHIWQPRHYKSEYSVKFIPPSDYLFVDGLWVKNNYIQQMSRNSILNTNKNAQRNMANNDTHSESANMSVAGEALRNMGNHNSSNGISSVSNLNMQKGHLGDSWFDYILQLRKKADDYRSRGYGVNFSRDHLAQVQSSNLHFWEVSSIDSSISPDEEEFLSRRERWKDTHGIQKRSTQLLPRNKENLMSNNEFTSNNQVDDRVLMEESSKQAIFPHNHVNPGNDSGSFKKCLTNQQALSHNADTNFHSTQQSDNQEKENSQHNRDSNELSESLCSSLSLAEEVLERAQKRKNHFWMTK